MEILCEDMVSKNESLLLVCAYNNKVYIDDTTPLNDEDYDPMGLDMEQVIIVCQETLCYLLKKMEVFGMLNFFTVLEPID